MDPVKCNKKKECLLSWRPFKSLLNDGHSDMVLQQKKRKVQFTSSQEWKKIKIGDVHNSKLNS